MGPRPVIPRRAKVDAERRGPLAASFAVEFANMLRSLLQLAAVFALLCLGVSTAVLSYDVHLLARDADRTMRTIDDDVSVQSLNLAQDELQLKLVLDQVGAAATEQRAYWQKTSADSDKTVKALRLTVDRAALLLDHTDKQLNLTLLPDADRQLNLTAEAAQTSVASIGHAGDALAFQLDNLQPILANVDRSSAQFLVTAQNIALASEHGNAILLDGEKTADYYSKKLMTPATFAQKLAHFVLESGSEARILFVGH